MSRNGSTLICNVTFNKNGNQTISGAGGTTRFNLLTLNMGTSYVNRLDVTSSNFAAAVGFLSLTNGTLKMSGSFHIREYVLRVTNLLCPCHRRPLDKQSKCERHWASWLADE